jgi:hypothetical protein
MTTMTLDPEVLSDVLPARITSRIVEIENGCWEWTGARLNGARGYGQTHPLNGQGSTVVHRIVYEALVGPIPEGLVLDHLCQNPPCCNPAHLEPVTNVVNSIDRAAGVRGEARRMRVCKRGHPYGENDENRHAGYCRICHNEQKQQKRRAQR